MRLSSVTIFWEHSEYQEAQEGRFENAIVDNAQESWAEIKTAKVWVHQSLVMTFNNEMPCGPLRWWWSFLKNKASSSEHSTIFSGGSRGRGMHSSGADCLPDTHNPALIPSMAEKNSEQEAIVKPQSFPTRMTVTKDGDRFSTVPRHGSYNTDAPGGNSSQFYLLSTFLIIPHRKSQSGASPLQHFHNGPFLHIANQIVVFQRQRHWGECMLWAPLLWLIFMFISHW